MKTIIEPFRIKVVEAIRLPTTEDHEKIVRRAGFNFFNVGRCAD
jgi:tryptophanase